MKLFVACGAGIICSNFIRHSLERGKKSKVVNSDILSHSFPNGLRVRRRENQPVRGRRSSEPAKCVWKNEALRRTSDSGVKCRAPDLSNCVRICDARPEFSPHDPAPCHRTRRVEDCSRLDWRTAPLIRSPQAPLESRIFPKMSAWQKQLHSLFAKPTEKQR
jgi:hypothetical protein